MGEVSKICNVPLIVSGGAGEKQHLIEIIKNKRVEALAIGTILHFKNETVNSLKTFLKSNNVQLRTNE